MLELVIAVVVAFSIGLLIGITGMRTHINAVAQDLACAEKILDEVYWHIDTDLTWQMGLLRSTVVYQQADIPNYQRAHLRRLGSQLLRIKDKDEDHPDSVEGQ